MNFLIYIEDTNINIFDLLSANILGPGIRAVKKCNIKSREHGFIFFNESKIKTHPIQYMDKLVNEKHATISVRFDETKVPPVLTLSNAYGDILVGSEPKHFISVKRYFKGRIPSKA